MAKETNENLSAYSNLVFEYKKFGSHRVLIENDLKLSQDEYWKKLYNRINFLAYGGGGGNSELDEGKLLNALYALNGSVDSSANFYSVDIITNFFRNPLYFKYFYQLVLKLNYKCLNLNFRELQQNSNQKHPQFRVNLNYAATHLAPLNPYKIAILKKRQDENKLNKKQINIKDPSDKKNNHIMLRFAFYEKHILNKSDLNVEELRKKIGFEKDDSKTRDIGIVLAAKIRFNDLCAACSKDYALKDRSFKTRAGVYYLEAHHNLSFSSDPLKHDVLENIVPLCPTCHKALGKNKADELFQKSLIKNILEFSSEAKEFAQNLSQAIEENQLIDYIYKALK